MTAKVIVHCNQYGVVSLQNKKSPNHWLAIKNGGITGTVRCEAVLAFDHVSCCCRVVVDHFVNLISLIMVSVCVCWCVLS